MKPTTTPRHVIEWTPARRVYDYCFKVIVPGRRNAFWSPR